jgi:hypothetical protein
MCYIYSNFLAKLKQPRVNETGGCGPTYKYGSKRVRVLKHGPTIQKRVQRKRGKT